MFCTLCTGGTHAPPDEDDVDINGEYSGSSNNKRGSNRGSPIKKVSPSTLDHTVIPFSIAIKRMSEILIYKANECRAKVSLQNYPRIYDHCAQVCKNIRDILDVLFCLLAFAASLLLS